MSSWCIFNSELDALSSCPSEREVVLVQWRLPGAHAPREALDNAVGGAGPRGSAALVPRKYRDHVYAARREARRRHVRSARCRGLAGLMPAHAMPGPGGPVIDSPVFSSGHQLAILVQFPWPLSLLSLQSVRRVGNLDLSASWRPLATRTHVISRQKIRATKVGNTTAE